jgi:hypothetical protein
MHQQKTQTIAQLTTFKMQLNANIFLNAVLFFGMAVGLPLGSSPAGGDYLIYRDTFAH